MILDVSCVRLAQNPEEKEKKNYARISYRHECESVIPMFNIASYVVTWGVMPLAQNPCSVVSALFHQ